MKKKSLVLGALAWLACLTAFAQQGPVPGGVPHLDHVFVIMMENHGYGEIISNPNAPFINQYARSANLATNYFAVAHPSLTNYLEVVGGSNFGIHSDNPPDWHNGSCATNLSTGAPNTDDPPSPNICPVSGSGTDAATPVLDCTNEVTGPPCEINLDGKASYPAVSTTLGITIADQLADVSKTWKTYQEDLPQTGPDTVNYSDGNFTNNTDFTKINPQLTPPLSSGDIVQLYAAKHNPFVYFQNVQQGTNPLVSYAQIAGFDGWGGLWSDLGSGRVPNFSYIVPNQCNDQHGRGNGTAFCGYDPNDNGTQAGLNPALIQLGDQAVQKIVTAIHGSPAWRHGRSAIVVIWDENDYSVQPVINKVAAIVDTNYGFHELKSGEFYTHFSLLRTIEGGLGLPCLNHACDASTRTMTDLFGDAF
ncbi:Phosphoesterase [Candidatus Sulfotelmatobacter kueseliae]|uniref:Phosphoesterase n=1 Tax=Candidatus Sulfotelmatobacter kueseliae TaxID=2042962 RepID=A0A2U3L301_9BACT|nr:Phosphoesterase [Candidatus Sulfotelmatobacter kueseliae]